MQDMNLYLTLQRLDVPTRICTVGNDGVESSGDNVPTGIAVNSMWPRQDTYEEPQCELTINLVTRNRRKTADTPQPKRQAAREECSNLTLPTLKARPGDSEPLKGSKTSGKWNVVNPNNLLYIEEICVGRGYGKKRKPGCNGRDRAAQHFEQRYPVRKGADFQLVLTIGNLRSPLISGDVSQ